MDCIMIDIIDNKTQYKQQRHTLMVKKYFLGFNSMHKMSLLSKRNPTY